MPSLSLVARYPAGLRKLSPGRQAAWLLLAFAAVWLLVLDATALAPPADNIEQLVWVRSLEWGYYKHPPLPTFLLWLPAHVLGLSGWTSYLLGAAVTLGAMAIFWRLLCEMRGPAQATLALLATLCITYYNGRLYYYNHNVVLLLCVTAAAWMCWRAFERRQLRWWALLGAALRLGGLAKYQIAVTVMAVACFWVSQRAWRDPLHRRGALLGAGVALLVMLPHLLWLPAHGFAPIRYAMETSLAVHLGVLERLTWTVHWEADQLFNRALPALVLLGIAWASTRRPAAPSVPDAVPRADRARALLLCWGLVPLVFIPFTGIAFGSDLQLQWGTSFLLFVVPCLKELRPAASWARVSWPTVWKAFGAIQLLLLAITVATSPIGFKPLMDKHWRTFAARRMADGIADPVRRLLGGPVRVIVGSGAEPGALSLQLPERPVVLIDGRYERSPWVSANLLASCGGLELLRSTDVLPDATPFGPRFPGLQWRIIPPAIGAAPCR
jgi:4-amino-4-deoxy-L-arabinose transferase-like glycosyltransferase